MVDSQRRRGLMVSSICLTVLVFAVDQLTKSLAQTYLVPGQSHIFVPYILNFTLLYNKGAAWGMGSGQTYLFVGIALATLLASGVYVCKARLLTRYDAYSMALLCSGALGNAYDRLAYGQVCDFLELGFMRFPIFNVADIAICLGIGLLVVQAFRSERSGSASKNC